MNNSVDNSIKNPSTGLTINSIGMEFVLISAGEFYMGSPTREKRRKLWEILRISGVKSTRLKMFPGMRFRFFSVNSMLLKMPGKITRFFASQQKPNGNMQ